MAELVPDAGFLKNGKLKNALLQHKALSRNGLSERLFGLLFSGLVYPQIWEDPDVDMAGMELSPGHSIVCIGSGGCNMLAYLSRHPSSIDVVDLNPHHIAARQLRLIGMCNHPPTGYVISLKLLEKHQRGFPLREFVTHRFSVGGADAAMAQAMKLDETMKVVITP